MRKLRHYGVMGLRLDESEIKCYKCGNKCKTDIKFEEFPQILIVVIKSKNGEKFFLKNNFKIIENKQFLYSLHCVIEKNTNNFYFLNKSNS